MTCKSVLKDHNGNDRDHSLFFVSSLEVIGKPYNFEMYECFICVCCVRITFYMHCIVLTCMLLICDTEINKSINQSAPSAPVRHNN